jgi:type IX secretion system PorP/SprF family membrane protein
MTKQLLLFSILLLCAFVSKAQDPRISQYYNQPLYVNPAYAGMSGQYRVGAIYQKLYMKIPTGFSSYNISFDMQAQKIGGLGLTITSDVEGAAYLRTNCIEGIYSYAIHPDLRHKNNIIQVGFKAGVYSQSLDYSKLIFKDQLDANLGLISANNLNPNGTAAVNSPYYFGDFSFGVLGRFNQLKKKNNKIAATHYCGLSIAHITQPMQSFLKQNSTLPIKFTLSYFCIVPIFPGNIHKQRDVVNSGLIIENQGPFKAFLVGANIQKSQVYGGAWFKQRQLLGARENSKFLVLCLGSTFFEGPIAYKIGYSYDFVLSSNASGFGGTHELSISMQSNKPSSRYQASSMMNKKINCYNF